MANKFLNLLQQILDKMEIPYYRKEVMNIDDLAKYTGWSKSYCYQLTSQRIIPFYRPVGKSVYFRKSEIDKWIFRHRIPTSDELFQQHIDNTIRKDSLN